MCGIVGVVNRENTIFESNKLVKFFKQALFVDSLRGHHGTGILAVDSKANLEIYKRALSSPDFLELPSTDKIINDNQVFMVGHNRWATQGSHTSQNTHPFSNDNIHLVHNGTLNVFRTMVTGKTFTVDSDAISALLATEQPTKDSLEQLDGAYSLVWYDEYSETLKFARNEERPMYIATLEKSNSMLFGSESGMLEWLAERNSIKIDKISSLKTGVIFEVPLDPKLKASAYSFTPKEKPVYSKNYYVQGASTSQNTTAQSTHKKHHLINKTLEVVGESWTPYQASSSSPQQFGYITAVYIDNGVALDVNITSIDRSDYHKYLGKKLNVKVTSITGKGDIYCVLLGVVSGEGTPALLKGPNDSVVSLQDFKKKVSAGCCWCGDPISEKAFSTVKWSESGEPWCGKCDEEFEKYNTI